MSKPDWTKYKLKKSYWKRTPSKTGNEIRNHKAAVAVDSVMFDMLKTEAIETGTSISQVIRLTLEKKYYG